MNILVKKKNKIFLNILYNPFDLQKWEKHELVFNKKFKLSDYLIDLPEEVSWAVAVNNNPIQKEDWVNTVLNKEDHINLVLIPNAPVKAVLSVLYQIGVAVAPFLGALTVPAILGAIVVGGLTVYTVGSMLFNAFFKSRPSSDDDKDKQNYGYDGAKNTSEEGIAVPVVFGEYRVAGNFVDIYSENVGDNQFLYLRSVLSEGEIDSVSEVEINEQPLSSFKNVEWGYSNGSNTTQSNALFGRALTSKQKNIKLDTSFTTHITSSPVEQFRLNLIFPRGLVEINEKDGKKTSKKVDLIVEYKSTTSSTWLPLSNNSWTSTSVSSTTTPTSKLRVGLIPTLSLLGTLSGDFNFTLQYKKNTDSTWVDWKVETGTTSSINYNFNVGFGAFGFTPSQVNRTYEIYVPSGLYQVRAIGANITSFEFLTSATTPTDTSISKSVNKTVRITFESGLLPLDTYEIRIKRTTPTSTGDYIIDEVYLSEIFEILTSPIALRNTATGWLKILMSDQLQNIPNVTWKTKGILLEEYDRSGNIINKRWSANNAWIFSKILLSKDIGRPEFFNYLDFSSLVDFANYCDTNNITYNGVFDRSTTVWDACQSVLSIGHASIVQIGSKFSIVIDKPSTPVALFNSSAIIKDSLQLTYLPLVNRANQIEVSYFDKTDKNTKKTIRISDPESERLGEPTRQTSIQLIGVDNFQQANKEAWRAIYTNRLLRKFLTFDAALESLSLNIGDVALIQHDMTEWAEAGRLANASTLLNVKLDRPVTMETGKNYSVIIIYPALQKTTGTITNIVGDQVFISGATVSDPTKIKRIKTVDGKDRLVKSYSLTSPLHTAIVEDASSLTPQPCTLWDIDIIEERNVVLNVGSVTELNLLTTSPLPEIPAQYTQFIFGEKLSYKRPFRLRSVSGNDVYKRNLSWIEYNEEIYGPPNRIIPPPAPRLSKIVQHVTNLSMIYDNRTTGEENVIYGTTSWQTGHILNYAGCDIYISLNGSDFNFTQSVRNVSSFETIFKSNDVVKIKAVAFDNKDNRANVNTAPIINQSIETFVRTLNEPTNLTWTLDNFKVDAEIKLFWSHPTIIDSRIVNYEIQFIKSNGSVISTRLSAGATQTSISNIPIGIHTARIRSTNGPSVSNWVSVVVDLQAPELQSSVSGLKLNNGTYFISYYSALADDFIFSWSEFANYTLGVDYYFRDYEVKIMTPGGFVIRTEYTRNPLYVYSFALNQFDTNGFNGLIARREIKIEVRARGQQGQLSAPSTITVINDVPPKPSNLKVATSGTSVTFTLEHDTYIPDIKEYVFYVGNTAGIFTGQTNLIVYKGTSPSFTFPAVPGSTYYYRGGFIDSFGFATTTVKLTDEATISPVLSSSNLYTWVAYADSSDGTSQFTTGTQEARRYVGYAYNKTSSTESNTPSDYVWSTSTTGYSNLLNNPSLGTNIRRTNDSILKINGGTGFDDSSLIQEVLPSNFKQVKFTLPERANYYVGISSDSNHNISSIVGIYLESSGNIYVQSGLTVGASPSFSSFRMIGSYTPGDEITLTICSGRLEVKRNGRVLFPYIFSSLNIPATGSLYWKFIIRNQTYSITNISVYNAIEEINSTEIDTSIELVAPSVDNINTISTTYGFATKAGIFPVNSSVPGGATLDSVTKGVHYLFKNEFYTVRCRAIVKATRATSFSSTNMLASIYRVYNDGTVSVPNEIRTKIVEKTIFDRTLTENSQETTIEWTDQFEYRGNLNFTSVYYYLAFDGNLLGQSGADGSKHNLASAILSTRRTH
jgi:sulfur carrier protein ThiS